MLSIPFAYPCMQEFSFDISELLMLQMWKSALPLSPGSWVLVAVQKRV